LSVENSHLKEKLDQNQKLQGTLSTELGTLRTQVERERAVKSALETENLKFREHWKELQQQLETEKTTKVSLAREIQELKKQIRQFELTQNAFMELTTKMEILDSHYKEEHFKRTETEKKNFRNV